MNAGQDRQTKKTMFFVLYENITHAPSLLITNRAPTALLHRQSTTPTMQTSRSTKHKHDSDINKAEHGYNIGMHAVNKYPVNNILRLNKVFL